MVTSGPLARIVELAEASASGEYICVSQTGEVHVYLQDGRIAWATDSNHPLAFVAKLQAISRIDTTTFRDVVEECRRERLALGETLVAWGLATLGDVRHALAEQIGQSLRVLASVDGASDLFLGRRYGRYDGALTFDIGEVIPLPELHEERPSLGSSRAPNVAFDGDLAHQLRSEIPGLTWVGMFVGDELVAQDPRSHPNPPTLPCLRATLLDDSEFAAIRSVRTSVLGFKLAGPRSVWCQIASNADYGRLVSTLGSYLSPKSAANGAFIPRPDIGWTIDEGAARPTEEIRAFMMRAGDVLGAIVLGGQGGTEPLSGCGAGTPGLSTCLDLARRRRPCLRGPDLAISDPVERAFDDMGFSLREVVTGERVLWCFGADLDPEEDRTLWMFLGRQCSQGLGWAYLKTLRRALSRT